MPVLHLNEENVKQLLTMEMAVEGVEAGLRKMALEEAFNIPRTRCQTDHTMLHVLSASAKSLGVLGFKAYTTNRRGSRFHVTIYDGKTGEMLALIQGDLLGRIRTGAASAVATKYLANPGASSLGVFGSGKQAWTQVLGICKVLPIQKVNIYSPNQTNRETFAKELASLLPIAVNPVATPEEAAKEMDVICTATTSREPVLKGEWLKPGAHLNIVGSNFLAKSEIDLEVVRRCSVLSIDHEEQGRIEAGDFVEALRQQVIHWASVKEISRIITGRTQGRTSPEEITLFKSLGIGLEDIAVAIRVYQKAKEQGVGQWLDL